MKSISFEFFPPKTDIAKQKLAEAASKLAAIKPDFFSVTYGAGGSTCAGTLESVLELQQQTHIKSVPHLSCINKSKMELTEILAKYSNCGISRILALRGDVPLGMTPNSALNCAKEFVQFIRETTADNFQITVACYPEIHPYAKNANEALEHFKAKVAAGANTAITQYFYNADAYFSFLEATQKKHIDIPIIAGIMPILNFEKLMQFSNNCGAEIPRWIIKNMDNYSDDVSKRQFGLDVVLQLCERLLQGGAPGLHFYTLNHAELSLQLCELLGLASLAKNKTLMVE